jgi:chromosome segregation ATPase
MLLYILLSIAVAFILGQAWLLYVFVNRIADLSEDRDKALENEQLAIDAYRQLDQGMVEISDAYETDSLQYESTIERLNEAHTLRANEMSDLHRTIRALRGKLERRNSTIDDLTAQLGVVRGENLHLRRAVDTSQRIISEHDLNCLPHIVLKSMEPQEQDTPLPL